MLFVHRELRRERGPAETSRRFTLPFLALLLLLPPHPGSAQDSPPPCSSPEARAFDFWVGEWEVRRSDGTVVGKNSIKKILNGCVLHERYTTPSGYAGESFNIFDVARGVWHQTWVDVGGLLLTLEGGVEDGSMVLKGETVTPAGSLLQRIRWSQENGSPGRVRQLWESSDDGGKEWTVVFDGHYLRVSPSHGRLEPDAGGL